MGNCAAKPKKELRVHKPTNHHRESFHFSTRNEDILDHYVFQKTLGTGAFGIVRKAHPKRNPSQIVAIKSIAKKRLAGKTQIILLKREIENLIPLDHPNIIKLYESFEDSKFVHFITEFCDGGELFERVSRLGRFSERDATLVIQDILKAIHYLHEHGICHRDLKPENFLFESCEEGASVKLIDFGLSIQFSPSHEIKSMKTKVGTPYYVAPEIILHDTYSYKCDLWSIGVIMYILLSGSLPFGGETMDSVLNKIEKGKYDIRKGVWKGISRNAKSLLSKLLQKDPRIRIDTAQALAHCWFETPDTEKSKFLDPELVEILKAQHTKSKFKHEAMKTLVKYVKYSEIKDLKEIFLRLDINNSGSLTYDELMQGIANSGIAISNHDAKKIAMSLDYNDDGSVNYSEFIAATLSYKVKINDGMIRMAFEHYDVDGSGYITPDNLMNAIMRDGRIVNQTEVLEMIKEVDLEETDGKVSYSEFKAMIESLNA